MKCADYKKEITDLSASEMRGLEVIAKLIQRRVELGLTQGELAKKTGLKQAAIARFESQKNSPSLGYFRKDNKSIETRFILG